MAYATTRVPEMAIRCVVITTSPKSATSLHRHKTGEGDVGYLASHPYRYMEKS